MSSVIGKMRPKHVKHTIFLRVGYQSSPFWSFSLKCLAMSKYTTTFFVRFCKCNNFSSVQSCEKTSDCTKTNRKNYSFLCLTQRQSAVSAKFLCHIMSQLNQYLLVKLNLGKMMFPSLSLKCQI